MSNPWICAHCGWTNPRHVLLEVACPECGAGVGQYCKRPSGHQGPAVDFHVPREHAAGKAGKLHICEEMYPLIGEEYRQYAPKDIKDTLDIKDTKQLRLL